MLVCAFVVRKPPKTGFLASYVSIGTNCVDQNQNAPTLYINSLICVHTACKKLLFIIANKDKSILRSMAQW